MNIRAKQSDHKRPRAFTLIELLVVLVVIGILLSLVVPSLLAARRQVRTVICRSNLRQLVYANLGYATESEGFFVPAAADMWDSSGLQRWHGIRQDLDQPFDPLRGPLASFLADGKVKQCPQRVDFVQGQQWAANFEQGCGGYGYNMAYLGSSLWRSEAGLSHTQRYAMTTRTTEVRSPGQTLMFADCALSLQDGQYIEYSFAEPPFTVFDGQVLTDFFLSPSIHFRHSRRANIGWTDGHIEPRGMGDLDSENIYGVESATMNLGWFHPVNNSLFDLQ
ncbi:MAG: prepilin-type N-terminal cleavage/methylation domain-containing protein [Sedimentisphaerales bacterium]|nr:prepilin-type N-terminal cleavage/methylation domain-containing protein [Sedimentisphaerales bacterium]